MVEEVMGVRKDALAAERLRMMLALFSGDWMEISALSEQLQIPEEKLNRAMSTLQRWSFLDRRVNFNKTTLPKKSALTELGESVLLKALATTGSESKDQ